MSELLKPIAGATARLATPEQAANYHSNPEVSQSKLKKFLKDPHKYWKQEVKSPPDPQDPPSASFQFGKDIETFLFQNRIPRDAVLIPEEALGKDRAKRNIAGQTNWTDWLGENNYSKDTHLLLKQEEYDDHVSPLVKARDNIMKHPVARKFLFEKPNEKNIGLFGVHEATGLLTRCELDIFSSVGCILDLKSTKETRMSGFAKEIWQFGYFIQAKWYQDLVYQLTGERYPFVIIAVGNKGGHYVETYEIDQPWMNLADPIIERGMARLAKAYEYGNWHTRTHGRIFSSKPHAWMKNKVWEETT